MLFILEHPNKEICLCFILNERKNVESYRWRHANVDLWPPHTSTHSYTHAPQTQISIHTYTHMNSCRVSDLPAKLPTTCRSAQLPSYQAVLSHRDKETMNCERQNVDFPGLGYAERKSVCIPNPKVSNVLLHGTRDSGGLTELQILKWGKQPGPSVTTAQKVKVLAPGPGDVISIPRPQTSRGENQLP